VLERGIDALPVIVEHAAEEVLPGVRLAETPVQLERSLDRLARLRHQDRTAARPILPHGHRSAGSLAAIRRPR
jgi:type IV secretory pathway ATPase VirB11/archaellum biosynthesis ATPase